MPKHARAARPPEDRLPGLARLRAAAGKVFTHPALLWSLTAIFAARALVLALLATDRPDARNFVNAGHDLLFDRSHLYLLSSRALATTGTLPVPGKGFLYPAATAVLAAPFSLLPNGPVWWTLGDAAAALAGIWIIYRTVEPQGAAKPLFWLAAAYFPPLFAEVDAGQVGGFILLLGAGSIALAARRPVLAGTLAGFAGALKIYPAGMLLGAGRRWRYSLSLVAAAVVTTVAGFVPLGWSGAGFYLRRVLIPAAVEAKYPDCAITSVKTLYTRTVGGESYALPGPGGGLTLVHAPFDVPALAAGLSLATIAVLVALCFWAARRSGWNIRYGLALSFALGAIVPAEVNPYQYLPLLPLALIVLVRALECRRRVPAILVAVAMVGFIRQPCDLPFPNLWTVSGVALYLVGVSQASLFVGSGWGGREDAGKRPGPVDMGGPRDVAGAHGAREAAAS